MAWECPEAQTSEALAAAIAREIEARLANILGRREGIAAQAVATVEVPRT